MIERSWHRPTALAVTALTCLWVGWRVVCLDLADHWAVSDPARALAWRADLPRALAERAAQIVQSGKNLDEARSLARASLHGNPLEGRAFRVLGEAAEQQGKSDDAARLFEVAARRAPRDLQSQFWLARHYLAQRRPADAMRHLDMLLRVEPEQFEALYPMLQGLATFPATRDAVVATLSIQPPWRTRFLATLAARTADSSALVPVFAALAHSSGGWSANEAAAWIDRLMRDGQWDVAYRAWWAWLPPDQRPVPHELYDGGFAQQPTNVGFAWRFLPINGAQIDRDPVEGGEGDLALHVTFADERVPFANVSQWLSLPPGDYRLVGRLRLDDLRNERGLQWRVACAGAWKILAESDRWRGTMPWQSFRLDFTVPAEGCAGQRLLLRLAARIPAEQLVGGEAWFDDLKIEPRRAPAP